MVHLGVKLSSAVRYLVLLFVFSIASSNPILAQDHSPKTYPFTSALGESDLPHYAVHHVMQDSHDFIWISTREGLCRFDGNECFIFGQKQGFDTRLTANLVWLTFEDSKGRIWMGSKGSGIGYYNYETDTYKTFSGKVSDSLSLRNNIVTSIFEDEMQNIWIGTDGGGLHKVIEKGEDSFEFRRISLPESELSILDMEQDHHGDLWLATYGHGVIIFDPETGHSDMINTESSPIALNDDFVMSIAREDSLFWVGTKFGGLTKIHRESGTISHFKEDESDSGALPNNFVWDIYIDDDQNKWVGTYGGGLAFLDAEEKEFKKVQDSRSQPSFTDDYVLHITQDKTGQFWVSTDNQGVFTFKLDPVFRPIDIRWTGVENTSNLIINDLFQDSEDEYWISTNHGLFRADPNLEEARLFTHDLGTSIFYEAKEAENKILWIASNFNLHYYDLETGAAGSIDVIGRLETPGTDRLFDIQLGNEEDMWLASDAGLIHYVPAEDQIRLFRHVPGDPTSLSGNKLNSIYKENELLWITTDDRGISLFDTYQKTAQNLDLSGYTDRPVTEYFDEVQADANDNIWLTSSDQGVYVLKRTGAEIDSISHLNKEDGLLSDQAYDVVAVDSMMLISLKNGFAVVDINTGNIQNIDHPPFLSSSGKSEFYTKNGTHYFFHKNRIFQIEAQNLNFQPVLPNVVLTGIEIYNEPIAGNHLSFARGQLQFDYTQDFITFSYHVLNYDGNRIAVTEYMLEGRDPFWLNGGESESINYTNLEPGTYTFKVRLANDPGSESVINIPLTVSPPFWETFWFRSAMILAVLFLLYSAYKYRMYYLLKEERTRNRIARDLHDDVSATLSSISFFSDAVRKVKGETSDKSDHYLELISQSASEAKEKINDIIWAIDPSKDDWSTFLTKCKRFAADALDSKEIEYELDISETFHTPVKLELRQNLWLIYKEMINNLVSHSKATKAEIVFKEEGRSIYLSVSDNGIGIDVEKESNRNGLKNIRQRAALLDGKLHLDTAPQKGTRWTLKVPV